MRAAMSDLAYHIFVSGIERSVGLSLIRTDVLNRYPCVPPDYQEPNNKVEHAADTKSSKTTSEKNAIHVMMYIFPRQFGLHNVFTSPVDARETGHTLKDYTSREDEIRRKYELKSTSGMIAIPKRLRGKATDLVKKLQILHARCPYKMLLNYYCPSSVSSPHPYFVALLSI